MLGEDLGVVTGATRQAEGREVGFPSNRFNELLELRVG